MYKIAICDDTAPLRGLLRDYVLACFDPETEFEFDEYTCGEEMLEAKGKKYDVILMDVEMKKFTGFETADLIHKEWDSEVPIIFLTGYPQFLINDWSKYGIAYLEKPVFLSDFKETIYKALGIGEN